MNPFVTIDKKNGLADNQHSPFYGRYRLWFDQVYPIREIGTSRILMRIVDDHIEEAKIIHELLPEHIRSYFDLEQQKEADTYIGINHFNDDDYFFNLNWSGDVSYIGIENFYFALLELSGFIEDVHFFIWSSGDGDDRWVDEYRIEKGKVYLERGFIATHAWDGILDFYSKKAMADSQNRNLKLFTTWQLYDRLNFRYHKIRYEFQIKENSEKNLMLIDRCKNDVLLEKYFSELVAIYQSLLKEAITQKDNAIQQEVYQNWCLSNQL